MGKDTEVISVPNYPSNSKLNHDEVRTVEKVISGNATAHKPSAWSRFANTFLGDDVQSVKSYIFYDMIIPGIKEGILGAIEMMFFGSTRGRRSSRDSRRGPDRASYTAYGDYSSGRRARDRRPAERYEESSPATMDDITFDTRADAELVLDALRSDIERYNEATLAAYYQYSGVSSNDFTANDRGWTNLDMNIRPRRVRGGDYILDLPRPQPLV